MKRAIVHIPYPVAPGWLLDKSNSQFVRVPRIDGLPETASVVSVHQCYERDSFAFIVEDESFADCPQGMRYPEIPVEWKTVELATKEGIQSA